MSTKIVIPDAVLFGRQIGAARKLLDLSQSALGRLLRISRTHISKIESGKVNPHRSTKARIQRTLEGLGVEFTNGSGAGVRLKSNEVTVRAGRTSHA